MPTDREIPLTLTEYNNAGPKPTDPNQPVLDALLALDKGDAFGIVCKWLYEVSHGYKAVVGEHFYVQATDDEEYVISVELLETDDEPDANEPALTDEQMYGPNPR